MTALLAGRVVPMTPLVRPRPEGADWLAFGSGASASVYVPTWLVRLITSWARQADPDETMGLLAGRVCEDGAGRFALLVGAVKAPGAKGSRAHVAASLTTMHEARRALRARYPIAEPAGWWHTHPGLGCFFSGTDCDTQATWTSSLAVGLVLDPRRQDDGALAMYLGPTASRQECLPGNPDCLLPSLPLTAIEDLP